MRILHSVEFYNPSVGGTQWVVQQLSERLASLGHEVTVATSFHPERSSLDMKGVCVAEFHISGSSAMGLSGDIESYRQFLRQFDGDVIVNFGAQHWATDLALELLPDLRPAKVIIPTGFPGLRVPEYGSYYQGMRDRIADYDACVLLSDITQDAAFVRESGYANCVIIPNGADEREFAAEPDIDIRRQLGIPNDHFLVLNVGTHTGTKGHSEAVEIFDRASLKNATLLIAGSGSEGCAASCREAAHSFVSSRKRQGDGKKLLVCSLTRDETVAAFHEADLFLFPSNVECSPLVLFECMASRTPFLATDAGNAREIIANTGAGLLLPTRFDRRGYAYAKIRAGSKMLEWAFQDRAQLQIMAEMGHSAWRQCFTWERIVREYESLYEGLRNKARNEGIS